MQELSKISHRKNKKMTEKFNIDIGLSKQQAIFLEELAQRTGLRWPDLLRQFVNEKMLALGWRPPQMTNEVAGAD